MGSTRRMCRVESSRVESSQVEFEPYEAPAQSLGISEADANMKITSRTKMASYNTLNYYYLTS